MRVVRQRIQWAGRAAAAFEVENAQVEDEKNREGDQKAAETAASGPRPTLALMNIDSAAIIFAGPSFAARASPDIFSFVFQSTILDGHTYSGLISSGIGFSVLNSWTFIPDLDSKS